MRSAVIGSLLLPVLVGVLPRTLEAQAEQTGVPQGWFLAGSRPQDYVAGVDRDVAHGGESSAFIDGSRATEPGFGTLMQTIRADHYRGQRVCLTSFVRMSGVEDWAGVWMRIDGPEREMLGFDNMQDRPLKGTGDWHEHQVVLDVPQNAEYVNYGILLRGKGRVWIDDLRLEQVDRSVPLTGHASAAGEKPAQPRNLDFEE